MSSDPDSIIEPPTQVFTDEADLSEENPSSTPTHERTFSYVLDGEQITLNPTLLPETIPPIDFCTDLANHPRYRVIERISSNGSGGVVIHAEHRLMGRMAVLKAVPLNRGYSPAFVDRFIEEIRATAYLNHPHIVTAYDAEATDNYIFLAMELLQGQDLSSVIRHNGPLNPIVACQYIYQAASALEYAHARGVLHRDVKPSNLVLVSDEPKLGDVVKLIDFGLTKRIEEANAQMEFDSSESIVGTIQYMSPEHAMDPRSVSPMSDIFSLGRTFYYLLTAKHPYPWAGGLETILRFIRGEETVIPIAKIRNDVPKKIIHIVEKMTERNPQKRYQSCEEILTELREILDIHAKRTSRPRWWRFW